MMQKMMKGPRQCKHTQTHTPTRAYTHPECNYGKLQRCPSVYLSAPACQSAPPLWTTCNIPAAKVVAQFQLLPQRTEKIKYIFIFLVSLLLLLLLLLALLLLLPLTVVAAFYAKINHKAAQPCSLFGSFFNVFFLSFFFLDLCAHLNLHLATTKRSFKVPFHFLLFSPFTLLSFARLPIATV